MPKTTNIETTAAAQVQEAAATQNEVTIPPKKRGRPTREEAETKEKRRDQADFLVGCSLEERSECVRLIRLLRCNYWLSNFTRQLLNLEADHPTQVPIEEVRAQLDRMSVLEELIGKLQYIASAKNNYFLDHPVVAAVMEEWGDEIFQYKSNRSIELLIESAKNAAVKK